MWAIGVSLLNPYPDAAGSLPTGYQEKQASLPQGQDEKSENEAPSAKGTNKTVAVVMGQAIVSGDVDKLIPVWKERVKGSTSAVSEDNIYWLARRDLAQRVLLVETAKIYAEDVKEDEVIRYWSNFPDLDEKKIREDWINLE